MKNKFKIDDHVRLINLEGSIFHYLNNKIFVVIDINHRGVWLNDGSGSCWNNNGIHLEKVDLLFRIKLLERYL